MNSVLIPLIMLSLSLTQGARAGSTITPSLDIPALTRDASIIAVGEVISIREADRGDYEIRGQLMPARRMGATFRTDRVLKGEASSELSFSFLLPDLPAGYRGIAANEFGMFFFRATSEGLILASPYYPSLVATRETCPAKKTTDLDRVIAELGCVLKASSTTIRERAEAIQGINGIRTEGASTILRLAAQDQASPINVLAASLLLTRNDISALPIVERALQTSPMLVVQDKGYRMEMNLGHAIRDIKAQEAIPALTRLVESSDAEIRRGAANALRNTGTEAAIEPLTKALYDEDWEVRWVAVMGLAGITGQDRWYPAHDEFKRNEQLYLEHWKSWANQRPR